MIDKIHLLIKNPPKKKIYSFPSLESTKFSNSIYSPKTVFQQSSYNNQLVILPILYNILSRRND